MRFLDAHFGGAHSPRGQRERSRTRDSLLMALTHCEVEFSNRLMFVSEIEDALQVNQDTSPSLPPSLYLCPSLTVFDQRRYLSTSEPEEAVK